MRSESQKRADAKYKQQKEHIGFDLPIGTKDRWKKRAESLGMSLTVYITKLIEDDIKKSETTE